MPETVDKIASGKMLALARAAAWIEDRRPEAEPLLRELYPHSGHAQVSDAALGSRMTIPWKNCVATQRSVGHI
jgi:hypothetical protein